MIAYLDTSVLLRFLLGQKDKLREFSKMQRPISSKLLKAECLRCLDRLRINGQLSQAQYLRSATEFYEGLESIELIEITDAILDRSGASFPVALGTLDAIHLSSALYWREQFSSELVFLSHDKTLGMAAKAMGFDVLGC